MDCSKDKNFNFIYMEDNGDGTITGIFQFGDDSGTMVMPVSMEDIMTAFMREDDIKEYAQEVQQRTVLIPDEPDTPLEGG